jgi:hypothetical protein
MNLQQGLFLSAPHLWENREVKNGFCSNLVHALNHWDLLAFACPWHPRPQSPHPDSGAVGGIEAWGLFPALPWLSLWPPP